MSPRIDHLLRLRISLLADLRRATSKAEAAAYRADLRANAHSLALAGHPDFPLAEKETV